jgi:uncharacterized membrane protein (DUF2068 family)
MRIGGRRPARTRGGSRSRRQARQRRGWLPRFWHELGSVAAEHDPIVRLIIAERLIKATVLLIVAVSLVTADRLGYLQGWASWAQDQLNLAVGHALIARALAWVLDQLGRFLPHVTVVALAIGLYALLEGTEGIGLALRRRWAEYLTVLGTAVFIPYEALDVLRRVTVIRVGALLVNVAIVVYLAYRKRLFIDV